MTDQNMAIMKINAQISDFIVEKFANDYSPEQVKEALEEIIEDLDYATWYVRENVQ